MGEKLRASVIVPAFNAEHHLLVSLPALARSDFEREQWELIVVDDGSTDGTAQVAGAMADCVVRTGDRPRGPAFARNLGATLARGDVVVFVDADVAVHPDSLRLLVEALDDNAGLVAVFGSYDDQPSGGSLTSRYRNLLHHYAHHRSAGKVTTFWAGCGAVRRSAFRAVGGFDAARYPKPQIEDIDLGYRLRREGEILLAPSIQGTHHKSWSTAAMLRTDFRDRAVPWVKLLLGRQIAPGGSTPSLGVRTAFIAAASSLGLALLLSGLVLLSLPLFGAGAALIAVSALLNLHYYKWLWLTGGPAVTLVAIPLQVAYHVISALAVPVGALQFMLGDQSPRSPENTNAPGGAPNSRFLPLALGEVGARLIAFTATAYLARKLGASGFGQIAFAIAVVSHFGIALGAGIGEVGARDVARDPDHANRIAASGVSLRLALALAAILGVFAVSSLLNIDPGTRYITWLYAFSIVPLALDTGWVYKGLGRTGRVGSSLLLSQLLSLVFVLLLVARPSHAARVPLIQIGADMVAAGFLMIPLMRGKWHVPVRAAVLDLARRSRLTIASRILRTIVVSFDVVLLGLMVSTVQVGLYSAAYRIIFFVAAIIVASHTAFVSEAARATDDTRALSAILSRTIGMALTVTIPFVVGGILIAKPLMTFVFGAEYASGALALQILLLSLGFLAVHGATRNVFLALHRMDLELIFVGAGVVANVALNLALIPSYGTTGAAIATVVGEAVIMTGVFASLFSMGIRPALSESVPAIVSGVTMAAVLVAAGSERPVLQSVAIGGLVYAISIVVLNLLSMRRAAALTPKLDGKSV